jgi:hypothetical protein
VVFARTVTIDGRAWKTSTSRALLPKHGRITCSAPPFIATFSQLVAQACLGGTPAAARSPRRVTYGPARITQGETLASTFGMAASQMSLA